MFTFVVMQIMLKIYSLWMHPMIWILANLHALKTAWLICALTLGIASINAQQSSLDFQFGINVPKPIVVDGTKLQSKFTHNFFVGVNFRKVVNPQNAFNIGFYTNGINYRFASVDSPQVTFLTMNYLSIPVQWQWMLGSSKFSILAGLEPKMYIRGYENTALPEISNRIKFESKNGIYSRYNLGLRAGVGYRVKQMNYFLQLSGDLFAFKSYKATRIYDNKLMFGFTFLPIVLKK